MKFSLRHFNNMQPNMLFIQIYKGKSHISASPLLITILISILPCLSTEIDTIYLLPFSTSHMKTWTQQYILFSICPSEKQIWCSASSFIQWSLVKTKTRKSMNHRLQPFFFARMVTKPGTASTEPSNASWVAEAARLTVYKCFSIREVSQQGPSGRVFSNKKRNWQNRAQSSSWNVFKTGSSTVAPHWSEFVYQLMLI